MTQPSSNIPPPNDPPDGQPAGQRPSAPDGDAPAPRPPAVEWAGARGCGMAAGIGLFLFVGLAVIIILNPSTPTPSRDAVPSEAVTPTTPEHPDDDAAIRKMAGEYVFLDKIKPLPLTGDDPARLRAGYATCAALDRGGSLEDVARVPLRMGLTAEQTGVMVGASVGALCPKYLPLLSR